MKTWIFFSSLSINIVSYLTEYKHLTYHKDREQNQNKATVVKPVEVVVGIALSLPQNMDGQNLWVAIYVN